MRKRLNILLGTLVLAPAVLAGCNSPAYHPKLIEKRDVPTLYDSAGRWQTFYNKINDKAVTPAELKALEQYNALSNDERRKAAKNVKGLYENARGNLADSFKFGDRIAQPVQAHLDSGALTRQDLVYTLNVGEASERFGKEQGKNLDAFFDKLPSIKQSTEQPNITQPKNYTPGDMDRVPLFVRFFMDFANALGQSVGQQVYDAKEGKKDK